MADQCEYIIHKNGARCSLKHKSGETFCKRHKQIYEREMEVYGPILYGYCVHKYEADHERCNEECMGDSFLCERHRIEYNQIKTNQSVLKAKKTLIKKEFNRFMEQTPTPSWKHVVEECVKRGNRKSVAYEIALKYFERVNHRRNRMLFVLYWEFATVENTQPINPYIVDFVADTQNVHTEVVSTESNKAQDFLLSYSKPVVGYKVLEFFEGNWVIDKLLKEDDPDVYEDMKHWYDTETCVSQGDKLYRGVLNGLYYYISSKPASVQIELLKRAHQECLDSVGLCCQGHITRLCNVLIGFEDRLVVEQSTGEKLQEKMAELAVSELSTEEKKKQANAFMDTLELVNEERMVWLEALGE